MRGHCGKNWRGLADIPEAILAMAQGRHGSGRGHGWGADWGRDWGQDWGRGGGRGRRRMFEASEMRLVLLKLIADESRHGYDLMRAIEELTGGNYAPSPGVVYPMLTMLEDMGLIDEIAGGGSRKAYSVTAEGRAHLEENAEEVAKLFERLKGLDDEQHKAGRAPIGRAVGNLFSALRHRVARNDLGDERLHEIAAILDEAAQKIERLK